MFRFLRLWLGAILRLFRSRQSLLVENLALRQQLSVFKRRNRRPKLVALDKLFWVMARRFWSDWKKSLLVVAPETVVRWHGAVFRLYWHDLQDQKAGWQKQDLPRSA
jgi:putative transposase